MRVLRNTHMSMPTAAMGRPARGPGVQPSIDFFCSTHCVCVHSSSWSAKGMFIPFSWLHPWMILQHTCVCSQQQTVGQSSVDLFCNTCVFAHSSNRSAKVLKLSKLQLTCSAREMCVSRSTHVYAHSNSYSSWLANPDPWVPPSIDFFYNTHVCVVAAAVDLPKLLNVQSLHLTSSLIVVQHTCVVHSSNWSANPQLTSSATRVCTCSQQQSVCQSLEIDKA